MAAVSLVDGMGEVMGMFCVLVDKDGVKDVSVSKDGMVKDVSPISPGVRIKCTAKTVTTSVP